MSERVSDEALREIAAVCKRVPTISVTTNGDLLSRHEKAEAALADAYDAFLLAYNRFATPQPELSPWARTAKATLEQLLTAMEEERQRLVRDAKEEEEQCKG